MKNITGTANLTQPPAQIIEGSPVLAYLGVDNQLKLGISALLSNDPVPAWALSFLCSHSLECLLKAFIKSREPEIDLTRYKIRHSIEALWEIACKIGLDVEIPQWALTLSNLHQTPYHLRYATSINGLVLPNINLMTEELDLLRIFIHENIAHQNQLPAPT